MKDMDSQRSHLSELSVLMRISTVAIETEVIVRALSTEESVCGYWLSLTI